MNNDTKSSTNVQDFTAVLNEVSAAAGIPYPMSYVDTSSEGSKRQFSCAWVVRVGHEKQAYYRYVRFFGDKVFINGCAKTVSDLVNGYSWSQNKVVAVAHILGLHLLSGSTYGLNCTTKLFALKLKEYHFAQLDSVDMGLRDLYSELGIDGFLAECSSLNINGQQWLNSHKFSLPISGGDLPAPSDLSLDSHDIDYSELVKFFAGVSEYHDAQYRNYDGGGFQALYDQVAAIKTKLAAPVSDVVNIAHLLGTQLLAANYSKRDMSLSYRLRSHQLKRERKRHIDQVLGVQWQFAGSELGRQRINELCSIAGIDSKRWIADNDTQPAQNAIDTTSKTDKIISALNELLAAGELSTDDIRTALSEYDWQYVRNVANKNGYTKRGKKGYWCLPD